ncbi:MAG TPA: MBL fold metallo-hydrolase [Actinomycetota bacterium]|nr:MBL fold metallo-hydrolase [Actinomycetota bacterium]
MGDVRVIPFLVSELRLPQAEQELLGVEWWPSYAHAVVHRDGVFLFDNGAGTGNAEVESTFTPRVRPIEGALESVGISLADVTGAANCHLHFDHSGQNARLTGMPIFVQRTEWAKVHEPDYTVAEWIDVPGLAYELLDGEAEVATGLRLVPTPGHTAGHQSLVIDDPDGTIVLAGQAVRSRAEWDGSTAKTDSGRPDAAQGETYDASVARLRSLAPARVHFAHDDAVWER